MKQMWHSASIGSYVENCFSYSQDQIMRQFLFLTGWYKTVFYPETTLPKPKKFGRYHWLEVVINMKRFLGKSKRDHAPTLRKTEGIYKSRGFHKAFNKAGTPLLVKSSQIALNKWNVYA